MTANPNEIDERKRDVFPDPVTYKFPEFAFFGGSYYYAADIIAFGIDLDVENLGEAYTKGIFPWFISGLPLPWFCPRVRSILRFEDLQIPKSLVKVRRKTEFSFTVDRAFEKVIVECASVERTNQDGTWITEEFIEQYLALHRAGVAHSIEAWDENDVLVGGLYGVDAGGVFCGESMFHRRSNASKLSLLFLIDHLKSRGAAWIDIQMMTPHMEALGAIDILRMDFLNLLRSEQARKLSLFDRLISD